ncbi:MAG: L,D-transpeptidase family protein [Planctomycetes bacterium]|nr:L,D-transpeptidase family protein [Planctomycetota bacterium]
MASRRGSGRRGKGGKGVMMLVGAVLLAGAGGGGYMVFGPSKGAVAESPVADLVPGLGEAGKSSGDSTAASAQSLAEVATAIAEAEAALGIDGEARPAATKQAYHKLGKLLEGALPVEERRRALPVFHALTSELFLSPVHNEFSENYTVKPGDAFDRIASRAGISTNLLYDLNNKPRGHKTLHPGENLKLPKGKVSVVVRKRDYTTSLYFGEFIVRQYVVAHGTNDNTPEGVTQIASMSIDPEKQSRGPNDPVNEMRLRWIGLENYKDARSKDNTKRTGIGLHGTAYPDSIPGMTSRGCVRMADQDVVELYDIVRIGNKVEIKA